jgi:hypothetical protein
MIAELNRPSGQDNCGWSHNWNGYLGYFEESGCREDERWKTRRWEIACWDVVETAISSFGAVTFISERSAAQESSRMHELLSVRQKDPARLFATDCSLRADPRCWLRCSRYVAFSGGQQDLCGRRMAASGVSRMYVVLSLSPFHCAVPSVGAKVIIDTK